MNLEGQRFGRLLALHYLSHPARWDCLCDCGTRVIVARHNLRAGSSRSCGCLRLELMSKRATIHGATKNKQRTRGWECWSGMMRRCYDPKHISYKHYGARGITVCERWHQAALFLHDMGEPPKGLSLGRKDNNKGYILSNCQWETAKEQSNNTRGNVRLTYRGRTMTVSQWAEALKVPRQRLFKRLEYGWSVERTLTEPLMREGTYKQRLKAK